jgi:hypothetical protein
MKERPGFVFDGCFDAGFVSLENGFGGSKERSPFGTRLEAEEGGGGGSSAVVGMVGGVGFCFIGRWYMKDERTND